MTLSLHSFYLLIIMISKVTQIIKATNLSVEIDSSSVFKVRGSFQGCDVVISADHYLQKVSIVSRSFAGHKEYSYPAFIQNFA